MRVSLLRHIALAFALGLGVAHAQSPRFSDDDRRRIMRYWQNPDRYVVALPADAFQKGPWQVRLTVAGSKWFYGYVKGKKLPPTVDLPPITTDEQRGWETWIVAKLARDRWLAWTQAQKANADLGCLNLPISDATIPSLEPADPGPAPVSLTAMYGEVPPLAEAVSPMEHTVRFDDMTVVYRDNFRPQSPRYAFYRYTNGVGDGGTAVKRLPPEQLDALFRSAGVSESEARVMKCVSILEGGFDSVNTYDTGFVSVGFIQFACLKEGGGALGAMLRNFRLSQPSDFNLNFHEYGVDVTDDGKLVALDLSNGAELTGPDAAGRIIEDKRLIAVFSRAGRVCQSYLVGQIQAARQMFYPGDDLISITVGDQTVTGRVSDIVHSEAGLATLMDRKVNTGNIQPFPSLVASLAAEVGATSLADLAPYEKALVQATKLRKDYLSDPILTQPAEPPRVTSLLSRGAGGTRTGRSARAPAKETPPITKPKTEPVAPPAQSDEKIRIPYLPGFGRTQKGETPIPWQPALLDSSTIKTPPKRPSATSLRTDSDEQKSASSRRIRKANSTDVTSTKKAPSPEKVRRPGSRRVRSSEVSSGSSSAPASSSSRRVSSPPDRSRDSSPAVRRVRRRAASSADSSDSASPKKKPTFTRKASDGAAPSSASSRKKKTSPARTKS